MIRNQISSARYDGLADDPTPTPHVEIYYRTKRPP